MKLNLPVTVDQAEVLNCKAFMVFPVCGRRWGKTTIALYKCLMQAVEVPGSMTWFCALSYQQALDQMRRLERSPSLQHVVKHAYKQFPPRLEFFNGSEIHFKSLDRPENMLGAGLNLVVVDEAARVPEFVIRQVLMPMTADVRGQLFFPSTYNGRNWFYHESQNGLKRENWARVRTFVYPTSSGYAFRGPEGKYRLEILKASMPPALWSQECECEPLASTDSVFRYVDRAIFGATLPAPEPGHRYIMGLDLGRVVDPTSWAILDERTGQVVATRVLPLGTPHEDSAKEAAKVAALWRAFVVMDATGGASGGKHESYVGLYVKALQAQRMTRYRTFYFTPAQMESYVGALALGIEQGRVRIPMECTELLAQVRLYRYAKSEMSKWVRFGAPSGEHDDLVAALIMGWWAREKAWPGDPAQSVGPEALL